MSDGPAGGDALDVSGLDAARVHDALLGGTGYYPGRDEAMHAARE